jgi:hypothetical protein
MAVVLVSVVASSAVAIGGLAFAYVGAELDLDRTRELAERLIETVRESLAPRPD